MVTRRILLQLFDLFYHSAETAAMAVCRRRATGTDEAAQKGTVRMVKINVNDKGECRVFVRGNWDDVRNHLLVAATKVRTMAADTRKFARAASGITPLADLKKKPEEPKQEPIPAWQPQISRPASAEQGTGGKLHGGAA
ncbi:hypothetical protein SDC9_72901 [bioreactor metagenome]|uniref:Uncharacterized protein n=1 Tax=bioreactor metagenome TaxID=1076179 RepID=A0A644YD24_9ZZZZ